VTGERALRVIDHGNVGAALRRVAVPTAIAIVSDQLLGIADTIAIGTFGTLPLAAVTAAGTIFVVLIFVSHGFVSGLSILGAQAIGANDGDRFGRLIRASVVVPMLLAFVFTAASIAYGHRAMQLYVGELGIAGIAAPYLMLRCASLIPIAIGGVAYSAFAAAGNTGFGARLVLLINAVHIPLLLVLALGVATHHPLGVLGAGISSLLAESAGAIYSIVELARHPEYRVFAGGSVDLRLAWRIAVLSAPEALYLLLVIAPDIVIIAVLAPLGASAVAAFRVLSTVSDVTFAVPSSLGSAAQTIIGQRFGAADPAGAKQFDRRARRYGVAISTLCGAVVAAAAWPLGALVTLSPVLATAAAGPLALHMLTLPLKGYAMLGLAPIRAAGDTRFSMIVGIVASSVVVPVVMVAVNVLHVGLFAVPIAWLMGWLVWCALTAVRLHRYEWSRGTLTA